MSLLIFNHGYALLVGVGESSYPKWSLPVTVKDAYALKATLTNPSLCAYPDDDKNIRILHDKRATKSAILEELKWLSTCSQSDSDATVLVFYSGHGWLDQQSGHYYLIPHDVEPYDLPNTAIRAEEFTEAIRSISARRLLVIMDCCHAEGMATAKGEPQLKLPKGLRQEALVKGLEELLIQGSGRVIFTSSRGNQSSWIRPDGSLSIYTYHLIEAFQGAGSHLSDTVVKISNLMNYVGQKVPESARQLCNAEQTPFFDSATEDFAVALLGGGKGLPTSVWEPTESETHPKPFVESSGLRNVTIGGDVSGSTIVTGSNNKIGSNNIDVGNISNSRNLAIGSNAYAKSHIRDGATLDEIARAFTAIYVEIDKLSEGPEKDKARQIAQNLEQELKAGRSRWNNILDALLAGVEVGFNALVNPFTGVAVLVQKLADKIKEEREEKARRD